MVPGWRALAGGRDQRRVPAGDRRGRDFAILLPQCDYISIHVPVTDDTKGLVDARRIDQMKNKLPA